MGEAGVFTSGCILGLCQHVSGCLRLYQPGSRHRARAWVGIFSDAHRVWQPQAATEKQAFRQSAAAKRRQAKKL